jgi:hypothetical protein
MEFLIGVVVGFVLGYGVREAMSRYRRSRYVEKENMRGHLRETAAPNKRRQTLSVAR